MGVSVALGRPASVQIRKWIDQNFHRTFIPENLPHPKIQTHGLGRHRIRGRILHSCNMYQYLAMRVRIEAAADQGTVLKDF